MSVRGRDFRFKPDGSAFEAVSGGGQFGHAFDDWGHRFTCSNSNHVRQIVLPAHYLKRQRRIVSAGCGDRHRRRRDCAAQVFRISSAEPWRVVRTRQRAADPVLSRRLPPTELFATGFFTSATGITVYRGSAYPAEFRGNVFIGDAGGNLIHRKFLEPDGATWPVAPMFQRRVCRITRQLVPAGKLRQHARRNALDPRHVREHRAPAVDPRADQEAPRLDERQRSRRLSTTWPIRKRPGARNPG